MWTTNEEPTSKTRRLPATNEVEKKDKWVKRNVHFPEKHERWVEKECWNETKWSMNRKKKEEEE